MNFYVAKYKLKNQLDVLVKKKNYSTDLVEKYT